MKYLLITLSFFFICQISIGRGWFVNQSTGNDTTGTGTIGAPYRSLAKINSVFSTFSAGDSVCLAGGQVFYGSLIVNKSGTNGNVIKITSYGSGLATISGFTNVTGWNLSGTNTYTATAVQGTNTGVSMVTKNNIPLAMGRWPNGTTYALYDVGNPSVSIISRTNLPFDPTGATVCPRLIDDILGRFQVNSISGNTINYTTLVGTAYPGMNGFGYFIQNSAATLDVQDEWYFPTNRQLQIYSTTTPTNIKISTIDTLLYTSNFNFINVSNLIFEGADKVAIQVGRATGSTSTGITLSNLIINNSGRDARYVTNTTNFVTDNVHVNRAMSNAIYLASEGGRCVNSKVLRDSCVNIGYIQGLCYLNYNTGFKLTMEGIANGNNPVAGELGMIAKFNSYDTVGHVGVRFYQNNSNIDSNKVNYFCFITGDAGGINTFGNFQNIVETNRTVVGNIITNGIGAPNGANGVSVVNGYYNDDGADGVFVKGNGIANINGIGIYDHNGNNLTFINNTTFNCLSSGVSVVNDNHAPTIPIRGIVDSANLYFAKANTSLFRVTRSYTSRIDSMYSALSNNRYGRPTLITSSTVQSTINYFNPRGTSSNYTLPTWQTAYSGAFFGPYDNNSSEMGTNPNVSDFVYNAGNADSVLNFNGLSYLVLQYNAPYQTVFNNSMPLKSHTGYVRIANGAAPPVNKPPVANAGADSSITLPQNSVHLMGSGNDSDGTVVSYAWSQISGPNTATFTPSFSTTTGNSIASGLIQGIYQFQLTVTDNNGATGTSIVRVTVNAAIPNTPPTANAGSDQSITLPTSSVSVTATSTNGSGTSVIYSWSQIGSTPTVATIVAPNSATTTINSLSTAGTYKFKVLVTNNLGDTATSSMQVIVNPAVVPPNQPPTANIAVTPSTSITLPTSQVTLDGSGSTDPEGAALTYVWSQTSGPSAATIGNPTGTTTIMSSLIQGDYIFNLVVKDTGNLTGTKSVTITVNPATVVNPPIANAGTDSIITLPQTTVHLLGSGTNGTGTINSHTWTIYSMPVGAGAPTFADATQYNTTVSGLNQGTYLFQLSVTDTNSLTATDLVQVIVNPAIVGGYKILLGYSIKVN